VTDITIMCCHAIAKMKGCKKRFDGLFSELFVREKIDGRKEISYCGFDGW